MILCSLFYIPYEPMSRRGETGARLLQVKFAMRMLEEAHGMSIGEQLRCISGGANLQEKWELLVSNNASLLGRDPSRICEWLCYDGWGNRFNVEFKTNLLSRKVSQELRQALRNSGFDVMIWSSGPNGTNDFGYKDDIVLFFVNWGNPGRSKNIIKKD